MVEGQIQGALGTEKMEKIVLGLEGYIKAAGKGNKSDEVLAAIQVLSALADFVDFKAIMLAKKAELNGEGGGATLDKINKGVLPLLSIKEIMDSIEILTKAATEEEGWTDLFNDPDMIVQTKVLENGDLVMRSCCELELSPLEAHRMFTNTD